MATNDKEAAILLKSVRKFNSRVVKIPQKETKWAKERISKYLKPILTLCRTNNKQMISHYEYTGSFYEKLKTEKADEIDIMVALKGKESDFEVSEIRKGYAHLKPQDSSRFASPTFTSNEFIMPSKVRQWFFGSVQKSVNEFKKSKEKEGLPVDLVVTANGPAVTLVLTDKEDQEAKKDKDKNMMMKLSVDLVPAFLLSDDKHYVAKPLPTPESDETIPLNKSESLWRQSFSLKEKELLKNMDKPQLEQYAGCRHDLVRITKTVRRKDPTLAKLTSYHIKTAFLHYQDNVKGEEQWRSNMLAKRFVDFLQFIMEKVKEETLPNYFIADLNLLQEIGKDTLKNIEGRLTKLVNSSQECNKVLKLKQQ